MCEQRGVVGVISVDCIIACGEELLYLNELCMHYLTGDSGLRHHVGWSNTDSHRQTSRLYYCLFGSCNIIIPSASGLGGWEKHKSAMQEFFSLSRRLELAKNWLVGKWTTASTCDNLQVRKLPLAWLLICISFNKLPPSLLAISPAHFFFSGVIHWRVRLGSILTLV